MTLRTRILVASVFLILLPLLVLAGILRNGTRDRLSRQYDRRVRTLSVIIHSDLEERSRNIRERLAALKAEMIGDNRFWWAAAEGRRSERPYLLDYAGKAMNLLGLSMLQIRDSDGKILSSGHFRNEYDLVEPLLPKLLASSPEGTALVRCRQPEGSFLALACVDSLRLGGREFTLVGGVAIDRRFLHALVRDSTIAVSLVVPGEWRPSDTTGKKVPGVARSAGATGGQTPSAASLPDASVAMNLASVCSTDPAMETILGLGMECRRGRVELALPESDYFVRSEKIQFILDEGPDEDRRVDALLLVSYPRAPLRELLRSLNVWLIVALLASAVGSMILAGWLSARISRPIVDLARRTEEIDLDHLAVGFESRRRDEVGILARFLNRMTIRLRTSAEQLRAAEWRATLGEMARQVNHDVKNGLTPIRNVFRHLAEVAEDDPAQLAGVFRERRGMLESSIAYLEALAANYARISIRPTLRSCNLGDIVRQVASSMGGREGVTLELNLATDIAPVMADPIALRRIVENLVRNACESLEGKPGTVAIRIEDAPDDGGEAGVRLEVSDTGPGISPENLAKIFNDFYTTKEKGTGLGLSIVRRLVSDFNGTVSAESDPGSGARFIVWFPAAGYAGSPAAAPRPEA